MYCVGLFCSCLPWHEVFYDLLDHLSNCLNDAKNQSVFPLLELLYDVQQFKSGEPVSVANVSINEVSYIHIIWYWQCLKVLEDGRQIVIEFCSFVQSMCYILAA